MKITDKIVTSVTQPQQTNVLWHNPETGELKMFGNKGWAVVGGYHVVTVENNFNIEAKPNTFYDIKNNVDNEININFKDEEFYARTVVNEFVFNINSPANISFDKAIRWNNDNAPDLTKTGTYTISILNGIACYTFVNG